MSSNKNTSEPSKVKKKQQQSVRQKPRIRVTVDPGDASSQVEYQRKDEADICVLERFISPPIKDSQLAFCHSAALYWAIPGSTRDSTRGNLLALRTARVTLENVGPAVLNLRAERPYGFESDPTGTAFWEPMTKGTDHRLDPECKKVLSFGFVNNNFIVPKREFVGTKDCLHLLSISLSRSLLATSGANMESYPDQILLRISVSVIYESDGVGIGSVESFVVRYYSTDIHMRYTNFPPPPTDSVGQLRCQGGQIVDAALQPANSRDSKNPYGKTGDCNPVKATFMGCDQKWYDEVDGIDTSVVYDLDAPVICYAFTKTQCMTAPLYTDTAYLSSARRLRHILAFAAIPVATQLY